jgi:hypothetical protein
MRKKTLVLTTALSLSLSIGTTAFAAPVAVGDSGVFDAEYYADNNSDVEAAYGRDFNLLWEHFTTYGVNEGRLPFAAGTDWQAILASAATTNVDTQVATQTEETQTQVTPVATTSDFLAQNGLAVTPQGTVSFSYINSGDEYDLEEGEPSAIPTSVTVTETASSQAGYTDTIAQFTYQANTKKEETPENNYGGGIGSAVSTFTKWYDAWNVEVFDRYTGTVLGSYQSGGYTRDDGLLGYYEKQGSAAQYDCTISVNTGNADWYSTGVLTTTVTVHHPTSYDGVAFMYGTGGIRVDEEKSAIAGNSFTISDTPYALSNAKIFTASNK